MKIVIAPDSFKGSISARELCSAIREGIHVVDSSIQVIELPLADGGEGTMENMVYATKGKHVEVEVMDPLGRAIKASYGVLGDGQTVIIEMAQASGLPLLKEEERNPLLASSYGTGQLIRHALDQGYRRFIIGLGGSATNDGGSGLLKALGVKFLDKNQELLPEGGGALADLEYLDDSELDKRIKESSFIVASDVTNPLCGPQGASVVFGPQKGATPEITQQLDKALYQYGEVIYKQTGKAISDYPGSGAAGGTGAALLSFLHAQMKSGIQLFMETIQFDKHIQDADLIITGEGKLDSQTLSGKVIAGVSQLAQTYGVPTIAICGGKAISSQDIDQLGLLAAFSIVPGPCSLEQAMGKAAEWTRDQTIQILRLLKSNL